MAMTTDTKGKITVLQKNMLRLTPAPTLVATSDVFVVVVM